MQNIDFWVENENRSLSPAYAWTFILYFKKICFLTPCMHIFFTAIRQEIKDIEEGRYDSKMNPLKVSIEQI